MRARPLPAGGWKAIITRRDGVATPAANRQPPAEVMRFTALWINPTG
jgi:hypothetical protein